MILRRSSVVTRFDNDARAVDAGSTTLTTKARVSRNNGRPKPYRAPGLHDEGGPRRLPAAGSRSRRGYQERTNRSDDVDERPLSSTVTRPSAKVGVADPRKTSYFRMRASRSLRRTEGFSRVVQLHQIDPRHERAPGQGAAPGPFIGAPHDETRIVARSLGSPRGTCIARRFYGFRRRRFQRAP